MYASAEELLAVGPAEGDACVVSDLKLPGMSGLELLAELRTRGRVRPLILITAHDSPDVRKEGEAVPRQRTGGAHPSSDRAYETGMKILHETGLRRRATGQEERQD